MKVAKAAIPSHTYLGVSHIIRAYFCVNMHRGANLINKSCHKQQKTEHCIQLCFIRSIAIEISGFRLVIFFNLNGTVLKIANVRYNPKINKQEALRIKMHKYTYSFSSNKALVEGSDEVHKEA